MSKTITITNSTAAELLLAAQTAGACDLSAGTRQALISLLAPPVVVTPPPTGPQEVPGFAHVRWYEWDDRTVLKPINVTGWLPGSILVIAFTPTGPGVAACTSIDGSYARQTVALGLKPGDFAIGGRCVREDQNTAIQWQVGGSSRTACIVPPGTRVYLSYIWPAGDARIQVSGPK